MLGLPDSIRACLFDLDGVLTPTALVHSEAWKEMFDAFLAEYQGPDYTPFDRKADYERYVDGRPRADGTRTFLASRGIQLPEGSPDDPPDRHTVEGLSKRKDAIFQRVLSREGVKPYPGSVRYLEACRDAGLRRAVVSSSKHCEEIVRAAELLGLTAAESAVFEDALAGVEAGRAGSFGYVVGVDRVGQAEALREHGADVVVQDLAELLDRS